MLLGQKMHEFRPLTTLIAYIRGSNIGRPEFGIVCAGRTPTRHIMFLFVMHFHDLLLVTSTNSLTHLLLANLVGCLSFACSTLSTV